MKSLVSKHKEVEKSSKVFDACVKAGGKVIILKQ